MNYEQVGWFFLVFSFILFASVMWEMYDEDEANRYHKLVNMDLRKLHQMQFNIISALGFSFLGICFLTLN